MECIISNKNSNTPWKRLLAISVLAALFVLASAISAAAGPKSSAHSSTCPDSNALASFQTYDNVAAAFANNVSTTTTTYYFFSLANETPIDGVPGLIKYCVYPSSDTPTAAINVEATGANGDLWTSRGGSPDFSFGRPHGNPTNIPLDGGSMRMGTATWDNFPSDQTILLHINDPAVCASIYGHTSGTCFVKPIPASACNIGDTTVAYNAMPFGAVNCSPPSQAFEATSTSEFGDEVQLAAGAGRKLVSLKVLFSSYGCSAGGHWNLGESDPCMTTPGATFTHPITANIYAVEDCSGTPCPGTLLATVTQDQTIPYRPSADSANCGGTDPNGYEEGSRWFNPFANGGAGGCQYSVSTVLTFIFPTGITLPDNLIWTVAFNTTHYGPSPIGESASCFSTDPGCGYDSLNVGAKTYPGAPYAGTDVDPLAAFLSSTWPGGYCDGGADGTGSLRLDADCWNGYRPLGEIITTN